MRLPGIEPGTSAWKADILPLNYKRLEQGLVIPKFLVYYTYLDSIGNNITLYLLKARTIILMACCLCS